MKNLKMKSLKSMLPLTLLLLIVSVILFWQALPPLFQVIKGPQDLYSVDYSGDIEGLYVSVDLPQIYDYYCQEAYENGEVRSREYIIDGDPDYYFLGMRVMEKDMDQAETLLAACFDYWDGTGSEEAVYDAQYRVTGTIHAMPSDSLSFYHEYIEAAAVDTDAFLPYYLEVNKIGSTDTAGMIIFLVLALLLLAGAVFFLIWPLSGRCQKNVRRYIASSPNAQAALEKVEAFLTHVPSVNGLQYNQDFICGQGGATTAFGETQKLVWAYQHTTTHKQYFITVRKSHALMLAFADGTRQSVSMKKDSFVKEHLQNLAFLCPRAIIGYSPELDAMFRKDFRRFLSLKYYAAPEQFTDQTPGGPGAV